MGFKELSKFNDSLLAKQIWRLDKKEDSLFHKVFKAKFFPNCSIMECECSNKGSFSWKSIIQAKNVIDLGLSWRVGNGKSIQIRGDKWLPQVSGSSVFSSLPGMALNSRVCELIDHASHTWKSNLIDQNFLPYEAKRIKGIPLSMYDIDD